MGRLEEEGKPQITQMAQIRKKDHPQIGQMGRLEEEGKLQIAQMTQIRKKDHPQIRQIRQIFQKRDVKSIEREVTGTYS